MFSLINKVEKLVFRIGLVTEINYSKREHPLFSFIKSFVYLSNYILIERSENLFTVNRKNYRGIIYQFNLH